jgi:hypothetical protein
MVRTKNLNQHEVVENFLNGIKSYSSTGNLRHEGDGILWHYSTVEAFKTKNNHVVSNEDCWSAGFAYCPNVESDDHVGLNSLHLLAGDFLTNIHKARSFLQPPFD